MGRIIKFLREKGYTITFVLILIIVFALLRGDNEPKNLRAVLTPNPSNQNVTHYLIYWYQTDDTTNFDINNMALVDTVAHVDTLELESPYYQVVLNWVIVGARAVNEHGQSPMGLSRFYSYFEFFAPSTPQGVRIKQ